MQLLARTLTFAVVAALPLVVACAGGQQREGTADHAAPGAHAHGDHHVADIDGGEATSGVTPDLLVFDEPPPVGTRARCPVTGEIFVVSESTAHVEHEGRHYVLCCEHCRPAFEADPASYVEGGS